MNRRLFLAGLFAAVAAVVAGVSAEARMHAPYRGHRIIPAGAAPLDAFATPSGAYSFRKLKSTYAGPAVRLRRASDNAELDINFLGCTGFTGCPIDMAAANAHCASTTCFGRTWYDQSGNARDLAQITTASQPQLIFSCQNGLPCFQASSAAVQRLDGVAFAPASPVTINAVASRVTGTVANSTPIGVGLPPSNRIVTGAANIWTLAGSAGSLNGAVSDGAWHAVTGVIQGAGSILAIDGAETTASITVQTGSGIPTVSGNTGNLMQYAEAVWWSGYGLTPAERTALNANQHGYWGF